jgi:hypothetical protein
MEALLNTDDIFEQTLIYSYRTLTSFLGSYQILLMDPSAKLRLSSICSQNKVKFKLKIKIKINKIGRCFNYNNPYIT